jgi:hypothetical protein
MDIKHTIAYAHALGSAIGLIGKDRMGVNKVNIALPTSVQVATYDLNSWSVATDLFIISSKHPIDDIPVAMSKWCKDGFDDSGEQGKGISQILKSIITSPTFKTDATTTAREKWRRNGCRYAPALAISSAMGLLMWDDFDLNTNFVKEIIDVCDIISPDPRVIISSVHICMALKTLMTKGHIPKIGDLQEIVKYVSATNLNDFRPDPLTAENVDIWPFDTFVKAGKFNYIDEYYEICKISRLPLERLIAGMETGVRNKNYAPQLLAFANWALYVNLTDDPSKHIRNTLIELTYAGGNSDNICAVVCTILAIRYHMQGAENILPGWYKSLALTKLNKLIFD